MTRDVYRDMTSTTAILIYRKAVFLAIRLLFFKLSDIYYKNIRRNLFAIEDSLMLNNFTGREFLL